MHDSSGYPGGFGTFSRSRISKKPRAGICHDTYSGHQGVEHDNMNVLVMGSRVVGEKLAEDIVRAYLPAKFTNEERHVRRLAKVAALEQKIGKS